MYKKIVKAKYSHRIDSDDLSIKFEPKIEFSKRDFDFTVKQKKIIERLISERTNVVFLSGPAGCTKTYLSIYAALRLLQENVAESLMYIRTVVESGDRNVGTLPGSHEEKLMPYSMPLDDKLFEILKPQTYTHIKNQKDIIECIPVNYLRGRNWEDKIVVFDEAQNATFKELTTALTRIGENTKLFICGDAMQSDINGKSGFSEMMSLFTNQDASEHGIYCYEFDESDIKRSPLVRYIVETISQKR